MAASSTNPVAFAYPHIERHAKLGQFLRNSTIGFLDGLTVPFALTAGLSSLGSTRLVILGGLAELFAGSISMGIGAYLAAKTDAARYEVEEERERREVRECPLAEEEEIYELLDRYAIPRAAAASVVVALKANEEMWVQFMMDFELKLEKPATHRAWLEALVMGVSYLMGGLLPILPYLGLENITHALYTSIGVTTVVLVVFGYIKASVTGSSRQAATWSALETLMVGAVAAATSYAIVRAVNSSSSL